MFTGPPISVHIIAPRIAPSRTALAVPMVCSQWVSGEDTGYRFTDQMIIAKPTIRLETSGMIRIGFRASILCGSFSFLLMAFAT